MPSMLLSLLEYLIFNEIAGAWILISKMFV